MKRICMILQIKGLTKQRCTSIQASVEQTNKVFVMLCHAGVSRCFRFPGWPCLRAIRRFQQYPNERKEHGEITATPEELESWRRGIKSWDQGGWLHLNAAGASPCSQEVFDAMTQFLSKERDVGGYEAEAQYVKHGRDARQAAAELLGCDADEIALTESAQSAWAKAFACLAFRPGDHIFCWASEYAGNAVAFVQAAKKGVKLQVLPMRSDGVVDIESLEKALESMPSSSRSLVALTHIQTNSSIVQPAAAVGKIAQKHGAIFLLDTCQSIGQLPVNLRALGCDFACGTGRKWLRGPRGTGLLYARKSVLPQSESSESQTGGLRYEGPSSSSSLVGEPAMIDHVSASWKRSDHYELSAGARRFEMWESSPALHCGLAVAIDACRTIGPERIFRRASFLAELLRDELRQNQGVTLRDAPETSATSAARAARCAIVTFEASGLGITADEIKEALTQRRIAVSVAPPFHTFDDSAWNLPATVRLSPSYYNTEEEIHAAAETVRDILKSKKVRAALMLDMDITCDSHSSLLPSIPCQLFQVSFICLRKSHSLSVMAAACPRLLWCFVCSMPPLRFSKKRNELSVMVPAKAWAIRNIRSILMFSNKSAREREENTHTHISMNFIIGIVHGQFTLLQCWRMIRMCKESSGPYSTACWIQRLRLGNSSTNMQNS